MLTEKDALGTNGAEVEALYDEFLDVILNGRGCKGVADLLAQKLQASVIIEDEFFCVLARSYVNKPYFSSAQKKKRIRYWKPQYSDPRIVNYVQLLKSTGKPVELPELPEYGINQPRMIFPVVIKNKVKAFLNVFKNDLNWYQAKIIRAALHSLVVLGACRNIQVEIEEKIKRTLILDLIFRGSENDKLIHEERQILGFNLSGEVVLAVIQIKTAPGQQQMEEALRSIINDLDVSATAIAINDEQAVLLVQPVDDSIMESTLVSEFFQAIFEALKMIFPNCKIRIGVGRKCLKPQDYKVAFLEACKALSATEIKSSSEEGVIYYHSLRLMEFLLQPENRQSLSIFVKRILGKLHDYSLKNNINLIESLECYLKHNCCIQSAARELYIHPNTLRYRIEKIKRITGLDLTDTDVKLEIQLAIKLYRYQGDSIWKA